MGYLFNAGFKLLGEVPMVRLKTRSDVARLRLYKTKAREGKGSFSPGRGGVRLLDQCLRKEMGGYYAS